MEIKVRVKGVVDEIKPIIEKEVVLWEIEENLLGNSEGVVILGDGETMTLIPIHHDNPSEQNVVLVIANYGEMFYIKMNELERIWGSVEFLLESGGRGYDGIARVKGGSRLELEVNI